MADFDEVIPGGLGPYILLPDWRFTFPVPVEDLEIPGRQVLFSGAGASSSAVAIRAVHEPATWATWGLIGSGALLVGRRRRA